MSTLPELPDNYRSHFTQIDESQLRIMWPGPAGGVIAYQNKPHWFEAVSEDDEFRTYTDETGDEWLEWYRRFLLIELSEEQYQEELYWYNLFREKVGDYWDYDEHGHRKQGGSLKPKEMHSDYYNAVKNRKPGDFANNLIVGWFEWLWGKVDRD